MSNRKATPGRIISQEPIYRKRKTEFGAVAEHTGRYRKVMGVPKPRTDRKMTDREKAIRRILKGHRHGKLATHDEASLAELRTELNYWVQGIDPKSITATE